MQKTNPHQGLLTEFKCKICGQTIEFDINNPDTYVSKTTHSDYFGMQLTTYRVFHETEKEKHYNAVVVDHKGLFRGFRDAYSEPLSPISRLSLVEHPSQEEYLKSHNYLELLLLVDRKKFWIQTYLCPGEIRPTELARLVMERIEEAERVYDQPLKRYAINVADKEMQVWVSKEKVVFALVKDPVVLPALEGLGRGLLGGPPEMAFANQQTGNIALKVLNVHPTVDAKIMERLVTDPMLYTVAPTPFQDRVNRVVEKVSREFPVAKVILRPLLLGQSSLLAILEDGYWKEITQIFEMVDYINRRGLLT